MVCIHAFFLPPLCVHVCAFSFKRGIILLWSLSRFKRLSVAFFPSPVHQLTFAQELRRDVRGLNLFQLLLQQPLPGAVGPAWQATPQPFPQPLQTLQVQGGRRQVQYTQCLSGTWRRAHVSLASQQGKAKQPSVSVVEKNKYIKSTIALRLQKRPLKGAEKGTTNALRIEGLLQNERAEGKGEFVDCSCPPKKPRSCRRGEPRLPVCPGGAEPAGPGFVAVPAACAGNPGVQCRLVHPG